MTGTRQTLTLKQWIRKHLRNPAAEDAIRLAVVLSILLSIFSSYVVVHLQECQQQYSEANASALRARDKASRQDRTAMDMLVTSVSTSKTADDTRAALKAYLDTRAEADRVRAENPLPVPERFC
jgi:sensor c-di-GMP phosphodiesterase-like protein